MVDYKGRQIEPVFSQLFKAYKYTLWKNGKYHLSLKGFPFHSADEAIREAKKNIDEFEKRNSGNNISFQENQSLSGVVSADQVGKLNFKKIALTGEYKKQLVRLFSDTQMMFWGMPGNGKTVWVLKFAQYLADKLALRVLYIAHEEWNRSTLTEKINEFSIGHKNLSVSKDLESLKISGHSLSDFDAIFFDSINSIGMNLKAYKEFIEANPDKIYVLVVQSTKDGDFKGGQDWEHEVDIAGEICQRRLELRKNRLDKDFLGKQNVKAAKVVATKKKG